MSGSEGFLARWSRRKQDTRTAPEVEALPPEEDASAAPGPEPVDGPDAAEPELTPEEIAQLPAPEAMTAETDLTQFLRKGVPLALRNAALRRMWSLDPGIRDYLDPAREYAYDWNDPNGIPGFGPLEPTTDVKAMLARVFGGSGSPTRAALEGQAPDAVAAGSPDSAGPALQAEAPPPDSVRRPGQRIADQSADEPAGAEEPSDLPDNPVGPQADPSAPRAEPAGAKPTGVMPPRARRHGGAAPV